MDGIWGLAGWKWMFIMVSLPCMVLGFVVLRVLADRPEEASWLSREEAGALTPMLNAETHDRPKTSLAGALSDVRVMGSRAGAIRLYARLLRHRHLAAADLERVPALQSRHRNAARSCPTCLPCWACWRGPGMRTGPAKRSTISRSACFLAVIGFARLCALPIA